VRCSSVALLLAFPRVGPVLAVLSVLGACAPKVSAGEWQCPSEGGASDGGASQPPLDTDSVTLPWSTGFEAAQLQAPVAAGPFEQPVNFCDYLKVAGYCYGDQPYTLVTEPHRGGNFAAEFKVISGKAHQTRCVRQGGLPESAYYGAWYFIPEALKEVNGAWNLWHFQGRDDPNELLHDLWDVTLYHGAQPGDWELGILDRPASNATYRSADHKRVPIAAWFHIELFLKRAADSSGKIVLYQDGVPLFERTNLKSDASKFTQWYVGDFANTPADTSLYVDDVSISATLSATP